MNDLVNVEIQVTKTDVYKTTVQMDRGEFKKIEKQLTNGEAEATGMAIGTICDMVDGYDVIKSTPRSIDAFRVVNTVTEEIKASEDYKKALEFVIKEQRGSTSSIQRFLKCSYHKAALIIETMESENIVSPIDQDGKRTVKVAK